MYKVRVLVGGDILVVRHSDKTRQRCNPQGVCRGENSLGLEPYHVLRLAGEAEGEWMEKNYPQ